MDDVLLTRRTLMRTGAAAGVTLLLARAPWAFADDSGAPAYLQRSSYAGLTGAPFTADGSTTLTLDAIGDLPDAAPGAVDAFALAFSGPAAAVLPQGIRTLSHPALGTFDVFIAPVARPDDRQSYDVIVDRSRGVTRSAPAPVAAAAVPAAPAMEAPATAGRPAAHAHAAHRTVRHATLRRAGAGVTAHLDFETAAHVRRVQAILMRHGHTLSSAHRAVSGAHAAVHLHTTHASAGAYDLLTITTDPSGSATSQVTRVTLH